MTGFIPAGAIQSMQMHDSPGLPAGNSKQFTVDEGQSTGGKVWETRPDRKIRAQRGLDFALWEEPTRKDTTRSTPGANLLASWWRAKEGKSTRNRERLASEAVGKLGSSGLTSWTTYKFPLCFCFLFLLFHFEQVESQTEKLGAQT